MNTSSSSLLSQPSISVKQSVSQSSQIDQSQTKSDYVIDIEGNAQDYIKENKNVPKLNKIFFNDLYSKLDEFGWYLPNKKVPFLKQGYLVKVLNEQVFRIKKEDVKMIDITTIKKLTRKVLFRELQWQYLQKRHIYKLPLGLKENEMPNREWLVNILNTIKPDSQCLVPLKKFEKLNFDDYKFNPQNLTAVIPQVNSLKPLITEKIVIDDITPTPHPEQTIMKKFKNHLRPTASFKKILQGSDVINLASSSDSKNQQKNEIKKEKKNKNQQQQKKKKKTNLKKVEKNNSFDLQIEIEEQQDFELNPLEIILI